MAKGQTQSQQTMRVTCTKDPTIMIPLRGMAIRGTREKDQRRNSRPEMRAQQGSPGLAANTRPALLSVNFLGPKNLDEVPRDCTVTLKCGNVPDNFNGKELQRTLANSGFHILDYKFKHDILTGERAGNGTIHVR
jgi:hypothetical protein